MRLPSLPPPEVIGQRLAQPHIIAAALAAVLVITSSLMTMYVASMAAYALPLALAALVVLVVNPYAVYIFTAVGPVFLPRGGRFFFAKVPDMFQFLVPVAFIASLIHGWRDKDWHGFRLYLADLFVIGFLVAGYIGIFREHGMREYKMYTNHQVLPALMYFVVRWQPLDRKRFRTLLNWHLLIAAAVLAVMLQSALTHFDMAYYWPGHCGVSRGPYGDAASAAACTCFLGALFIYAFSTKIGGDSRWCRRAWIFGCVAAPMAQAVVGQRAGFPASLAAIVLCLPNRKLFPSAARLLLLVAVVVPMWYYSPVGGTVRQRYKEQDAGWRRRVYREKAINYIKSPMWNPVFGTGYERLSRLSDFTIPDRQYWDPGKEVWRSGEDIAKGAPVHCAPLTMFGEYGWAGVCMAAGLLITVLARIASVYPLARQVGRPADTQFFVVLLAVTVSVAINAVLHNTDKNQPMALWTWNILGILVAHPQAFIVSAEEMVIDAADALKKKTRRLPRWAA